jgi:hypothetical protein
VADVSLGLSLGITHGRVITELDRPDDLAAGVAYSYEVTGGYWELPRALTMTVAAGADDTVTDVQLSYLDDTGLPVATLTTGAAIDASTAAVYSFVWNWQGAAAWSSDVLTASLPQLLLQPSWSIAVAPVGGWTEGQITQIRYYRERFITGPGGYEIGVQDAEGANGFLLQQIADRLS